MDSDSPTTKKDVLALMDLLTKAGVDYGLGDAEHPSTIVDVRNGRSYKVKIQVDIYAIDGGKN